MNAFDRYRKLADRTRRAVSTLPLTLNAGLGLVGEAGEVTELLKKTYFHGQDLDREKLKSELGDVLFYLDWLARLHGMTLGEVADANISKLTARYPRGFVDGGGKR
jgi:NTP pyrophosphatase (non-canonical NTP hydrolase)